MGIKLRIPNKRTSLNNSIGDDDDNNNKLYIFFCLVWVGAGSSKFTWVGLLFLNHRRRNSIHSIFSLTLWKWLILTLYTYIREFLSYKKEKKKKTHSYYFLIRLTAPTVVHFLFSLIRVYILINFFYKKLKKLANQLINTKEFRCMHLTTNNYSLCPIFFVLYSFLRYPKILSYF